MQEKGASVLVWHAVPSESDAAHITCMPRKSRPNPKPERQRTYIREWRMYAPKFEGKKLTLAKLSERLEAEHGIIISEGQLSRIERGEQGYFQDLLEAIADICGTVAASLIMRDPSKPEGNWQVEAPKVDLSKAEKERVDAYIDGIIAGRTGTEG